MTTITSQLPQLLHAIQTIINDNADEITELDKAIGDGDHVVNLQRGLDALTAISDELAEMKFSPALMKIGMTLMSTMGGASGSLFGTLFVNMAKAAKEQDMNFAGFAESFSQGVESVKQRGKADLGEKTMLDTLIPVANRLQESVQQNDSLAIALEKVKTVAIEGMQSTKDMLATKGRASFLGERAIGHIDAGARTSQLMICTIVDVLLEQQ